MKKSILCFVIALFTSLSISAQIQRTFFGFTLGKAQKSEIIKHFRAKGKEINKKDDNSFFVVDLKFGGHTWPYSAFSFYKGKLQIVYFSDNDDFTVRHTLDLVWNNIKSTIDSKYSQYFESYDPEDEEYIYDDNRTRIRLGNGYFQGHKGITLMYTDLKLRYEELESDKDEL